MYEERSYRGWVEPAGLVASRVCQAESDLLIHAPEPLAERAGALLAEVRADLEAYIRRRPDFAAARAPLAAGAGAPLIARRMAAAAADWGVGPMAAVAGALAEAVGERLGAADGALLVENGGDCYLRHAAPLTARLWAGAGSPFADRVRFRLPAAPGGQGLCTSSGTVGHSYSAGRADAVCVLAASAPAADAAATALANAVAGPADVDAALQRARAAGGLDGVLIACGERLGLWGEIELL